MDADQAQPQSLKIIIVGACASGKSTLVERLRGLGYDAAVCAQEHSEIQNLWRRTEPDIVVYLDVDLSTIRARRGEEWPQTIYETQLRRLQAARAGADVIVDSVRMNQDAVLARVLAAVEDRVSSSVKSDSDGGDGSL
jgi:GTPase SAR1 family protein